MVLRPLGVATVGEKELLAPAAAGLPVLVGRRGRVVVDGDAGEGCGCNCGRRGAGGGDTVGTDDGKVEEELLGAEGRGGTLRRSADVVAVMVWPTVGVGEVVKWPCVGLGMMGRGNGELERAPIPAVAVGEVGTVCTDVGLGRGGLWWPCNENAPLRGSNRVVPPPPPKGTCVVDDVQGEGVGREMAAMTEGEREGPTVVVAVGDGFKVKAGMGSGRGVWEERSGEAPIM